MGASSAGSRAAPRRSSRSTRRAASKAGSPTAARATARSCTGPFATSAAPKATSSRCGTRRARERRFEVDAAHRLEAERDEHGVEHFFTHDESDYVVRADAIGHASIDANGLLASTAHETFAHDARDRLVVRRGPGGGETRYAYDDLGQLVRADLPDGRVWRGHYDGPGRSADSGAMAARRRSSGTATASSRRSTRAAPSAFTFYLDARALVLFGFADYDGVDAEPDRGRPYFVFHDASGLPVQIEDIHGRIVWWADRVDPYGAITVHEGAELDYALRWPGHFHDPELGLHHNRFRAYDPGLARYLQPDPIGHAGSPHGLHAYSPSPLVEVDLLGLHTDERPRRAGASEEPVEGVPFAELAWQWGMNLLTRRAGGRMYGLTPAEVDRRAREPAQEGEPHVVERRRRHLAEHRTEEPMPMDTWARRGYQANLNGASSRRHEGAVLERLGAVPNNGPASEGGQRTHDYEEYIDQHGRSRGPTIDPATGEDRPVPDDAVGTRRCTVRPDGTIRRADGTTDIVEHKHFVGDEGGVLNDSEQLRGEREMARLHGGEHIVVITSDSEVGPGGPSVRPSAPLAEGSTVLYFDHRTGTMWSWSGGGWSAQPP